MCVEFTMVNIICFVSSVSDSPKQTLIVIISSSMCVKMWLGVTDLLGPKISKADLKEQMLCNTKCFVIQANVTFVSINDVLLQN